jgi:hypothetical protein
MEYDEFKAAEITCRKCGWKGTGAEMKVGEVYEGGGIGEYHCPKCGEYWGAVQWPSIQREAEGRGALSDQVEDRSFITTPVDSQSHVAGQMAGTVDFGFHAFGTVSATATAMVSAAAYFPDLAEREDWTRLPDQLAMLDIVHLRMLSELKEPVIPKLKMLTGWSPQSASDETVRLAATSLLNEKIAARERSHARVLAWIALGAGVLGFALGKWIV